MFVCQWHIDVPFGKQKEVAEIMKRWDEEMSKAADIPKAIQQRLLVGHIGISPSHIINKYQVASMADWEAMSKAVATGRWHSYSEEMAKFIVPGSQHWIVYRVA